MTNTGAVTGPDAKVFTLEEAILWVLTKHDKIAKEEIYNYIKYQALVPNNPGLTQVDVTQKCDQLLRASKIEKHLVNNQYLYSCICFDGAHNPAVATETVASPVPMSSPPQSYPVQQQQQQQYQPPPASMMQQQPQQTMPHPYQASMQQPMQYSMQSPMPGSLQMQQPPMPGSLQMQQPPMPGSQQPWHPPMPGSQQPMPGSQQPMQQQPMPGSQQPIQQQPMQHQPMYHPNVTHYQPTPSPAQPQTDATAVSGEQMFGNVATDTTKKMVYADSWKDCAGRESGDSGYQFGDVSRTVLKSLFSQ